MSTERTPLVTDERVEQVIKALYPINGLTKGPDTRMQLIRRVAAERMACELRDIYEATLSSKDAEIEALRNPWISVKDRLPIKERWVIVVADGAMNCAWYDKKRGWHNGFNERPKNIRIEEITHWMPLPTPPKP